MLREAVLEGFDLASEALDAHEARLEPVEHGTVVHVTGAVARIRGLEEARADEVLRFAGGGVGIATTLDQHGIGAVLLGGAQPHAGEEVRRTRRVVDVPVGEQLLGRVVDAIGRPLDERGPVRSRERRPVEREAPAILDRAAVSVPLQTGLKAIDALIPVGRGQRELVVGDRQTGKTAIAVDTVLNQEDVVSIYCAIGQRASAVARVISDLRARDALKRCTVVVAGAEDPPGLQFLAPYAAMAMAECFMEDGRDVLVVYDDLTRHARAYRELSLLLRRPPGREAYPGDIFYVHARLLERATHLCKERGGGSVTALPIIETQAQNLTAYIPTNMISITDGQIYLSPDLFQKGFLPAVDVTRSVSRVGGKAQLPAYREMAGDLRLSYSQYEELESFSRFGTRLDEDTRRRLERGRRVREVLKQPQYAPLSVAEQVATLLAVSRGVFDGIELDEIARAERDVREAVLGELGDLCERINNGEELTEDERRRLVESAERALETRHSHQDDVDGGSADPS